jgi:hypothetical protein
MRFPIVESEAESGALVQQAAFFGPIWALKSYQIRPSLLALTQFFVMMRVPLIHE